MTKNVLVVAAHPDDEVLGCGATIARLAREGHSVRVLLVADGETSRRGATVVAPGHVEARASAAETACRILGCESVVQLGLPDNRLDEVTLLDVVQRIEEQVRRHPPEKVFTHHSGDVNIDHRVVHDAVIAACRPLPGAATRELLFFEVPSSTEWRPPASGPAFAPNWFVDVSETLPLKLQALEAYRSELREFPHPRSLEAVRALAQWRGASAGVAAAEAFVLGRKIL